MNRIRKAARVARVFVGVGMLLLAGSLVLLAVRILPVRGRSSFAALLFDAYVSALDDVARRIEATR